MQVTYGFSGDVFIEQIGQYGLDEFQTCIYCSRKAYHDHTRYHTRCFGVNHKYGCERIEAHKAATKLELITFLEKINAGPIEGLGDILSMLAHPDVIGKMRGYLCSIEYPK
jgi:hypothetical protein